MIYGFGKVSTIISIAFMAIMATGTAATCADLVNPSTGVSDCTRLASYCNNALYYTLMTQQCPYTCGRCTSSTTSTSATTVSSSCVDQVNPSTGVSDCTRLASYCNNSVYYTLMTQQCPKTCGRCSSSTVTGTASTSTTVSSTCVDKVNPNTGVSDCTSLASYCNNSVYYTVMTEQCPKTCGRCTSG